MLRHRILLSLGLVFWGSAFLLPHSPPVVVTSQVETVRIIPTVFHSTSPSSVRLAVLEVEAPLPQPDNHALRELILIDIPNLAETLAADDTLAAALLLLEWAARTGDFAFDGKSLARNPQSLADLYYNYFLGDQAGMSCGGYGNYYSSILRLFDIDSLNIGFGELPELTHVTVVLPLREKETWNFYLLDPTFGLTFVQPGLGTLATYFDLVDDLASDKLDRWFLNEISLDSREFLSSTPVDSPHLVLQRESHQNFVYRFPGYGLDDYLEKSQTRLIDAGYNSDWTSYVQLQRNRVFNVLPYGPSAVEARQAFIDEVHARQIPFGFPDLSPAPSE